MKIVHIESGLGNQMLSYCEYLALKKVNPTEDIYIEDIIYNIQECDSVICQWNGYELNRIFGIDAPNIRSLYSEEQWTEIIEEVRGSEFWNKHWNYAPYITKALNKYGCNIKNIRGDFEEQAKSQSLKSGIIGKSREYVFNKTRIGNYLRRKLTQGKNNHLSKRIQDLLFYNENEDVFTGQRLLFKLNGAGLERIDEEVRKAFKFPPFVSGKNIKMAAKLDSSNSVFIHARRGDMLSFNGWCYKYGYFKRAVNYIKKMVDNPVFVFFTNTGSIEWCKDNSQKIFGLDLNKDNVLFVDWNTGDESYRDMQLMAHCKHGIITNSSFGWWGAYFIDNPNKITISPLAEINTTCHF